MHSCSKYCCPTSSVYEEILRSSQYRMRRFNLFLASFKEAADNPLFERWRCNSAIIIVMSLERSIYFPPFTYYYNSKDVQEQNKYVSNFHHKHNKMEVFSIMSKNENFSAYHTPSAFKLPPACVPVSCLVCNGGILTLKKGLCPSSVRLMCIGSLQRGKTKTPSAISHSTGFPGEPCLKTKKGTGEEGNMSSLWTAHGSGRPIITSAGSNTGTTRGLGRPRHTGCGIRSFPL